MTKRLKGLEARGALDGLVLTEAQLAALEKAKTDKEAHGERTPRLLRRPGYVLCRQSQGRWPGLPADVHLYLCEGRVRQAVRSQTPIAAADLLNDRVLPFFDEHQVKAAACTNRPRQRGSKPASLQSVPNKAVPKMRGQSGPRYLAAGSATIFIGA
jgi:hypothetical protein